MKFDSWVIDASMEPIDGRFCFCPVEGDLTGDFTVVTGFMSDRPMHGHLAAIYHPDGQQAVEDFCERHKTLLDSRYWEVR